MRTYAADEEWPRHDKKHWRDAYDHARRAGWQLVYVGADHLVGHLRCPCGDHVVKVDHTADGGENFAAKVPNKIKVCEKARGVDSTSVKIGSATQRLDAAEGLIAAIEEGLPSVWAHHEAIGDLDRLALQAETVEAALQDEALELAIATEARAPVVDDLHDMADDAQSHTDSAATVLKLVARPTLIEGHRTRLSELQERLDCVRSQLQALMP